MSIPGAQAAPDLSQVPPVRLVQAPVTPAHLAVRVSKRVSGVQWVYPRHLQYLNEKLTEALLDKHSRFILVELPIRFGKSDFISSYVAAWQMGRVPTGHVILTSYADKLVKKHSRRARRILTEYGEQLWGVKVRQDNRSVTQWEIADHGGTFSATTTGGQVTGSGGGLILIDDPIKDAKAAHSQYQRDEIWEWYQETLRGRLEPGGKIILIMCVAEGQHVAMGDGTWRKIEEVEVGDEVWATDMSGTVRPLGQRGVEGSVAVDHSNRLSARDARDRDYSRTGLVKRKVLRKRMTGVQQVFRVRTNRSSLDATPTHPVLVVDGTPTNWRLLWKQVGDLVVGDVVVQLRTLEERRGSRAQVPDGKVLLAADGRVVRRPVAEQRLGRVDDEFCWLMGFMFGDGWVTRHERKVGTVSYAVCAALGVHPDIDQRVADGLQDWFGRRPYVTTAGYQRLDSNDAGRVLQALGLVGGAWGKRVPEWVHQLPAAAKRAFLSGYFDADGTKGDGTRRAASVSADLLDDMRRLAMTCGVRPSNRHECHAAAQSAPNAIRREAHSWWVADFRDDRALPGGSHRAKDFPFSDHFRVESVTRIDHLTPTPVWDLTIDGDESFIAEGFVVHNSRWHEDDLAGRLIKQTAEDPEADQWERIRLPAIAEPAPGEEVPDLEAWRDEIGRSCGEPLWPQRWSLKTLRRTRASVGEVSWEANYQQRPSAREGNLFKSGSWKHVAALPVEATKVCARRFDLADSDDAGGDYAATALVALGPQGETYIVDVERWPGSIGGAKVRDVFREAAVGDQSDRPWRPKMRPRLRIEQEPGSAGVTIANQYVRDVFAGFSAERKPTSGSKELNAEGLASQQQAGNVYLVGRGLDAEGNVVPAPWWPDFKEESRTFPRGANDDMVDVCSQAYNDCVEYRQRRSRARARSTA